MKEAVFSCEDGLFFDLMALYSYIPISLKAHSYIILPTFLYRLDIGML